MIASLPDIATVEIRVFAATLTAAEAAHFIDQCVFRDSGSRQIALQRLARARASYEAATASRSLPRLTCIPRRLQGAERKWVRDLLRLNEHATRYGIPSRELEFVAIDLRRLIGAQRWVYEARSHCATLSDKKQIFELCTMWDPPPDPVVLTSGYATFVAEAPNSVAIKDVRAIRVSKGEVQIIASVVAKKNFMTVVPFRDEFILLNGYHRAIACLRQGVTEAYCVVSSLSDLPAGNSTGTFVPTERLMSTRAMLEDYLSPTFSVTLSIPRTRNVLEIGYDIKRRVQVVECSG